MARLAGSSPPEPRLRYTSDVAMGLRCGIARKLIEAHLVAGEMTPGQRDRLADRPDADPGRHRHDGDARAGGAWASTACAPSCRRSTSTTTCCRPTTATPTTTCSCAAPAGASASGTAKPGNGVSATRSTCSASACPGKTLLGSDSHTLRRRLARACWRSAPAASRSRMAMAGEPFYLQMPRDLGRAADRASCRTGSAPRTSSSRCCAATASRAASAASSSTTARARRPVRDGPARHREHGRRARRDHHRVPGRRRGAARSSRARDARDDWRRARSPTPTRSYDIDEEIDLSDARAADRACRRAPGQRRAGARGRRRRDLPGRASARRPTRGSATSRSRRRSSTAGRRTTRVSFDVNPTSRQIARGPRRRGLPRST